MISLRKSITLKISLLVLGTTCLVLALVVELMYTRARNLIREEAEQAGRNLVTSLAREIEQDFLVVAKAADGLASFVEAGTVSRDDLLGSIKRMVTETPEVYGSAVAFLPFSYDSSMERYAPYFYKSEKGLDFVQLGTESYNYLEKDWFRIPVDTGKPVWIEPYFDEGGGNVAMTTYARPVFQQSDNGSPAKMVGLKEVATKITSTFKIKPPVIDADTTRTREKINIEPGDSAWDALVRAAEANGLWPWFEPDGTLVIGGPDYSSPIVAHLIVRKSGKGNNALSIGRHTSMQGRYSDVTVLGQAHGTDVEPGRHALRATVQDTELSCTTRYRPKIFTDHECDSVAVCRNRARKLIADSRLNGLTLTVEVKGHRIIAPGTEFDGKLWKPGMRMNVTSERHGIENQAFFLMGRKFKRNRSTGTRTVLTLKEDGIWVLDAHPHKNTHRRGKNGPGQIIDVSAAK